jgi:hypothetical protein
MLGFLITSPEFLVLILLADQTGRKSTRELSFYSRKTNPNLTDIKIIQCNNNIPVSLYLNVGAAIVANYLEGRFCPPGRMESEYHSRFPLHI